MFKEGIANHLWGISLVLVFLLLCIWQIPGTIAVRYSLLALLLPISFVLCFRCRPVGAQRLGFLHPLVWLVLLTSWIILVIGVWGAEPGLSWKEFRGQWLTALLGGLVGTLLARAAIAESSQRVSRLILIVFWALFAQVFLHDVLDLIYWQSTGQLPFRQAPVLYLPDIARSLWETGSITAAFTGHSGDKFSYVNNTLLAFVVAELVQRIMLKKRWLPISWPVLLLSLLTVLACTYLLQFRNGNVGLLLLMSLAIFMVLVRKARHWPIWRLSFVVAMALAALLLLGGVLYKSDARWQTLVETAPIAWDTQTHQAWRHLSPYPLLANGQSVDPSNYDRIAWVKEGAILMYEHPLGTGYNRNAFGDGIDRKYAMNGVYRGGHAHTGLIDFGIANGVPGLVLWSGFLAALFYAGWSAFMRGQIAPGLVLTFIVSGFFSRSIVDSNIRDHMLQQFMFVAMLLVVTLPLPNAKQVLGNLND